MIDIVFLLIIFYISVYQITRVSEERLQLPQHEGIEEKEQTTVTINILDDGSIKIQGKEYSTPETVLLVGERLAEVDNEPSMVTVLIRADRRGTSRTVNELVRQFSELGITQVRIATETGR